MVINTVTLSGNLTRDAQIRSTKGGTPVVDMGLAVNTRGRDAATGEWTDVANFFDLTWYGRYAEKAADSLKKGTRVTVAGELRQRSWEGNDGRRHSVIYVLVNSLDSSRDRDAAAAPEYGGGDAAPFIAPAPIGAADVYDEDVPF